MRLLILGGTVFLGRELARAAEGHDVTCAARGVSGSPPPGVRFVPIDRGSVEGLSNLEGTFDAVIDVARQPGHVRHALAALAGRVGHWSFVSTCSVYADDSTPGQRAETAPLHEPTPPGLDEAPPEQYGPAKVACEQIVTEAGLPTLIDRAGLIVGPEDRSGRFDYWVSRLHRGGEILAPGAPGEHVQWIDVRDLAAWHVRAAETGLTGVFDGIGQPTTRGEFFAGLAEGLGVSPRLTWVPQDFLLAQKVEPWMGERSLPMWLPLPEYAGFMRRDTAPALAAGLTPRPLPDTTRDTLTWLEGAPAGPRSSGLTPEEESGLLRAWHAASA